MLPINLTTFKYSYRGVIYRMAPAFSDVDDQFLGFGKYIFSNSDLHCALPADCTEDSCSCTLVNF